MFLLSEGYPEERRSGILYCFCSQRDTQRGRGQVFYGVFGSQRGRGQVFYSVFALRGAPRGAPPRYFMVFLLSEGYPEERRSGIL